MGRCGYLPATFNKRLSVHHVARTPDGQGGFTEAWAAVGTVSASVEPYKGYERFQAMQTATPVTHKLVMRFTRLVATDTRLVYGTRVFTVKEALNRNEANRFLDVRAVELRTVSVTPTPGGTRILLEDGSVMLLEDGSALLTEDASAPPAGNDLPDLALEAGGDLLLESGSPIDLETP